MTAAQFKRRLRILIAVNWAIPPIFGLGFLVLVVQMFDLEQLGAMMTGLVLPGFILSTQVLSDWFFARWSRPIQEYLADPTNSRLETAALSKARGFTWTFWVAFLAYLLAAPVMVLWSAELAYGFEPAAVDWFRILLVSLVVSIIVGLPIFLRINDLFGAAFSQADIQRPHLRIGTKVFLIGALVPLLIDTVLVQYYWTKTGYFTATTFAVWLVLELLAILGALFAGHSLKQSLAPLDAIIEQPAHGVSDLQLSQLRPQSTDELGVLTSGYRNLLQGFQEQNRLLNCRNELLHADRTLEALITKTREVLGRVSGADDVHVWMVRGESLRLVAMEDKPFLRAGYHRFERSEGNSLLWRVLDDPAETGARVYDLSEVEHDEEFACATGKARLLLAPIHIAGQPCGAMVGCFDQAGDDISASVLSLFEALARDAGELLASSVLREEKQQSDLKYEQLTRFAPDAILLLDEETVLAMNEAAKGLFGDILRQPTAEMVVRFAEAEEVERIGALLQKAYAGGNIAFETALNIDGGRVAIEARVTRLPTPTPQIIAMVRDVSQRHALESQLRHAQKMEGVGHLAGGVAHDFNNLLSVIISVTSILAEDLGQEAQDDLETIMNAAERAAALTQQLLTFSRQQPMKLQVVNLSAVIDDMENVLRRLLPSSYNFAIQLCDEPWDTQVDRSQIEQVVVNLIVNARDATSDHGTVTVQTTNAHLERDEGTVPAGDWVQLSVTDDGTGIAPELRERIFEPYFTTKDAGKGSGLGLATVYAIVTQSGGHIQVRSAPQNGTTFDIYLPKAANPIGDKEFGTANEPKIGSSGLRVILAEDDPDIRAVVERTLKRSSFDVVATFGNGKDVVDALTSLEFDLLITDLVMPGLKGTEVARHTRQTHPSAHILVMSGYADLEMLGDIDESGLAFISKPFKPSDLIGKIGEVVAEGSNS